MTPMQTGDGLLARIALAGRGLTTKQFQQLCKAAQQHGNGVVEVTQRGNLQIRGLSAASAPRFLETLTALGIEDAGAVPMVASPLAGLDPHELTNAQLLVDDLRIALKRTELPALLDRKVSVAIDAGGALHLDSISADVRLRAIRHQTRLLWDVALGGNANDSTSLGAVAPEHATAVVVRLLLVTAEHGPDARARTVLRRSGLEAFRASLSDYLLPNPAVPPRRAAEPIGLHGTSDGLMAVGLGLAFGGEIGALTELSIAAAGMGAREIRPAIGRMLFAVGLSEYAAQDLLKVAQRLGLVVRSDDPRRQIWACAGAPICASGEIAARALAPRVAEALAPLLDGSIDLHISGCSKGCAHGGPAALTIVGTGGRCGIIIGGSSRSMPVAELAPEELPAGLARLAREVRVARQEGERTSEVLARWGNARLVAAIAGELAGA
jgi:precorrin-3B synthase